MNFEDRYIQNSYILNLLSVFNISEGMLGMTGCNLKLAVFSITIVKKIISWLSIFLEGNVM